MSLVRSATDADIPELVRLRALLFDGLSARGWGAPPPGDGWRRTCAEALRERLADDMTRILVLDEETGLAACGMGVVDLRLPGPYNPTGLIGHVYGVVTDPAFRRRGHSRSIMEGLLAWFAERGVSRVDLNATADGEPLYRSLGFTEHPEPMLSRKR
ncbi:GNAT family N-acetyltransferase [Actinoallomurus rhizosphaericola]|uniref:GNAT family N-acetyltransferase n=1 Tax=Actinoallomurus rhizosphaericola TaxID=2952536 RepID=UPI002090A063|nr:GNAT family N-acetyltransferase [Actinoallomurus rhizosphaericola]MCO5992691.1 GNAT family N-acetyltransferase [Actinoallomurus rhizosphaericola]